MQDLLAAGLKDWTAFTQGFICSTNVVNKLAFFSCAFAASEARFDEPRTPAFDNVRRRTHRIRSDRGMRKDDVTWRKLFPQLLGGLQESVVIRHKNLDVIAQVRQFPRRADKIWNRTRRSIPNEDKKSFAAR